jgi:hypothetical protein
MSVRVPDNTTVNRDEFKPDANVMAFAPELIQLILDKNKLTTYRFGLKYDYLKVGDVVKIQNSQTKDIVAAANITGKHITTFREIPIDDGSHETYRDKEHQRQVLSGYYAYIGRTIADDDQFLVFDFQLV